MINEFTHIARGQGWTLKELAVVWEISHRQMSNVAKAPKRRDLLALKGLGDKVPSIPTSTWRGHEIYYDSGSEEWKYSDTGGLTTDDPFRACGRCSEKPTEDDHDSCIANLPNVFNACCGHGLETDAYVQFKDHSIIRGKEAIDWLGDKEKVK